MGKGVLEKMMTASFGLVPLGVGDVCRAEKKKNSVHWQEAQRYMESTRSTLWPTEILLQVMSPPLEAALQQGQVILDGWLRDETQIKPLVQWVQGHMLDRIVIINFEGTDELCVRRAEERGREDDKDIHLRLQDFHHHAEPALAGLMAMGNVIDFDHITFKAENADKDPTFMYQRDFVVAVGSLYGLSPERNDSPFNVFNNRLQEALAS